MGRTPMPREVRPALGPGLEAVRLLFRQEPLEIAGLLTVVPAVEWLCLRWYTGPELPRVGLPAGGVIAVEALALDFLDDLLACGAILLLLSIARGERGLRPALLLRHFGLLALVAAVKFGVEWTLTYGRLSILAGSSPWVGTRDLAFRTGGEGVLEATLRFWIWVWAAWFLARRVDLRGAPEHAGPRLLLWPGLLAAALVGAISLFAVNSGLPRLWGPTRLAPLWDIVSHLGLYCFWNLLAVFVALWTIRSVENETDGWSPIQ